MRTMNGRDGRGGRLSRRGPAELFFEELVGGGDRPAPAGSEGVLRGMLLGTPREGDELIVSYPREPELRTGVTFRPTAP